MQIDQRFYVGTYTRPILFGTGEVMQGKGLGIYLVGLEESSGAMEILDVAPDTENPSFLALSGQGQRLYAVNELKQYKNREGGSVSAFAVQADGSLQLLNRRAAIGQDPCHVTVSPDGKCVLVSNFMTGSLALFPLREDGSLDACGQFFQHEGRGADPQRQAGPHAHSATFTRDGRFVLVPDLGIDQVRVYAYSSARVRLTPHGAFHTRPGAGPRYCEFHPTLDICYLINELNSSITALRFDPQAGTLTELETESTLAEPFAGTNICADLHVSADGRTLYGSNRGQDSIVVFSLDADGRMHRRQTVFSGGRTPRNFALLPGERLLVAANQDTDTLVSFFRSEGDGTLTRASVLSVPSPVCVRPVMPAGPASR